MNEMKNEMRLRWNTHADNYDTAAAHGIMSGSEIDRWTGVLAPEAPATLLDVGCGTGFVTILAAKLGLDVTGVDWSTGMMEKAREKAAADNLKINFVIADTQELPFEEERFDLLTARHVIWTLSEPLETFREWKRVLKTGGKVIVDYSPKKGDGKGHHYRAEIEEQLPLNRDVPAEEIAELFKEAGFACVEVKTREYTHKAHDTGEDVTGVNHMFICTK